MGLPSRVGYLSPQGVLLPRVFGTIASLLWLKLRGLSASQATPFWTVYHLACHRELPWLWLTFAMVPGAAWPGSDQQPWRTTPAAGPVGRLRRPSAPDPWGVICCFPSFDRPTCARVWSVLGSLAPVHLCGRMVCSVCSVCGVLALLAPVRRCAHSVRSGACVVSCATWLLFTALLARCVVFRLRCPGPLGSCSPLCSLGALCCVCGVRGYLARIHLCVRSECCVACAVSWATWLLFTGVPARCVVLGMRRSRPLSSCSPVRSLAAVCCVSDVLGHLAPVHRCAPPRCCVVFAVSFDSWPLFTGVPAPCIVLCVRCPGPLRSCSPVCSLSALSGLCAVLYPLAPVH